jgi:hypothetical protein
VINGIFIGFFVPPIVVIILAAYFVSKKLYKGDSYGSAAFSFVKTIAIGALVCIALLVLWMSIYYAGGGH